MQATPGLDEIGVGVLWGDSAVGGGETPVALGNRERRADV
jgi:hypothetical protein